MFDAEKLLGKVIAELSDSHYRDPKKYKKKYKHKKKKKHDLASSLAGNLLSGKGLMTAIGLGVGAYTILKGKDQPQPAVAHNQQPYGIPGQTTQTPPPGGHYTAPGPGSMPPPVPPAAPTGQPGPTGQAAPATPGSPAAGSAGESGETAQAGDLALNMIRVMIAVAHADGEIDSEEEGRILTHLREAGLSKEEKNYLLGEFHNPRSIEELTAGMNDPRVNHAMYSLAVSAVVIDNEAERKWFDDLARALSISGEMQKFIEEE